MTNARPKGHGQVRTIQSLQGFFRPCPREAYALWKHAQRDPKVGGETVSAMVMEARMMEQPELSCQRPMMPQA